MSLRAGWNNIPCMLTARKPPLRGSAAEMRDALDGLGAEIGAVSSANAMGATTYNASSALTSSRPALVACARGTDSPTRIVVRIVQDAMGWLSKMCLLHTWLASGRLAGAADRREGWR